MQIAMMRHVVMAGLMRESGAAIKRLAPAAVAFRKEPSR
jgi:hypothetical protein